MASVTTSEMGLQERQSPRVHGTDVWVPTPSTRGTPPVPPLCLRKRKTRSTDSGRCQPHRRWSVLNRPSLVDNRQQLARTARWFGM